MSAKNLKPGWKMVKFGDVVKNANLVERDPEGAGSNELSVWNTSTPKTSMSAAGIRLRTALHSPASSYLGRPCSVSAAPTSAR